MAWPRFPEVLPYARRAYGETGVWNNVLLDDDLRATALASPDQLALVDAATRFTYAEISDLVARAAGGLRRLGVRPGDVVSMQLPNWWEATVLHFAVVTIGAVCNPLMPILRDRDLTDMISRAGSHVLVVPTEYRRHDHGAMAARVAAVVPALDHVITVRGDREDASTFTDLLRAPATEGMPAHGRSADDPVVLLYTSGTESQPKGAVHSHNTLRYETRSIIDLYRLTGDDVVWAPSPVAHITGVLFAVHLPTMIGSPVVLQDVWDPTVALHLIQAERCSFVVAATPFLHGITYHPDLDRYDVASLRVFVCGGADVAPALIRDAGARLGVTAMRLYGSTEIPTVVSTSDLAPEELRALTDGRTIAAAEIRVVDESGTDVPLDVPGRLVARGPEAMLGYLGVDPQPFDDDGWFDTGDLGRMDAAGYVTVVGRNKDIIVRGGENISAKEVEDLLFEHPSIAEVAVVAVPDPRLAERACAVVVLQPGAALDLAGLARYLDDQHVARQKYPERLEIRDDLPKTPTGKIQKFALRSWLAELDAADAADSDSDSAELDVAEPDV